MSSLSASNTQIPDNVGGARAPGLEGLDSAKATTMAEATASAGSAAAKGANARSQAVMAPVRHRQFLVTLLGVYPIITLLLYVVLPMTAGWPIWQTTLIVAPLMVAIMVFWLIPTIQRFFGRFIMQPVKS